ncbi:MAG: AAA family ATPase [Oscillatoriales cyanobacterium SM2_3_0]|nr:AAA family ATPase [Oscillatoriales cyanobacterium SM2_3_0]
MTLPIVKRYLIAFEQYKWAGFAFFALVLGASGIVAMLLEPPPTDPYKATGILTYKNPPVLFSQTGESIRERGQQLTKSMLLQPAVVEPVLKEFNIPVGEFTDNFVLTVPEPGEATDKKKEETAPANNFISVGYTDPDRKRAVEIVNQLMQGMVEQSRIINTDYLTSIMETVQIRLGPAEAELRAAEKELETYDKREGATLLAIESGSLPEAIIVNQKQQEQTRLQLQTVESQIASLEDRLGLNADQAYVSQSLTADPIIAQLRVQLYQVESQLEFLRKDYRDGHPQVAALLKQKSALEQQLQARAAEVLGGGGVAAPLGNVDQIRVDSALDPARQQLAQNLMIFQTQKETLEQQVINLKESETNLRKTYASIPNKQLEKLRLEQEVGYKKALYDKMRAQLIDAQAAEAETVSSLQIAQPAIAPDVELPQAISMALILAGGGLAGVLGGATLIFLLGLLSGKFFTWEEIKGALQERDVPLLGTVPNLPLLDEASGNLPLLLKPRSPYLKFYEDVRGNLQRLGDKSARVFLLTSCSHTEGKTLSAYNLAIAAARTGKRTLLIEADLHAPSLCESLRLVCDPYSSVEPLQYYGDLNECVRLVPDVENLYIIPSPGPLNQTANILESSEMRRLLGEVRHRFDLVVIDVPALSENNDALVLEPYTDGMVVVARPIYTQTGLLNPLLDQLTEASEEETNKYTPRLLGVVINGADIPVELSEAEIDYLTSGEPDFPQPELTSGNVPQLPARYNISPAQIRQIKKLLESSKL